MHKERERSCGEEIRPIPRKSQEVPKAVINLMSCKCCMTNMGISCPSKRAWKFRQVQHPTHHPTSFPFYFQGCAYWCDTRSSGFFIPWGWWGVQSPTTLRAKFLLIPIPNLFMASWWLSIFSPQWNSASTSPFFYISKRMVLAHTSPCFYVAKCHSTKLLWLFWLSLW